MRLEWLALAAVAVCASCVSLDGCVAPAPVGGAVAELRGRDGEPAEIVGEPEGERVRALRGYCASPRSARGAERVAASYSGALRGQGSAPSLRGRVALVTVLVDTQKRSWTRVRRARLATSASQSRALLLREARRYGVDDLSIDLVTLDATRAEVTLPELDTDAYDRFAPETVSALDREVRRAAAEALGATLDEIATSFRTQGYHSVAFVAAFPFELRARDFAMSESSFWDRDAEVAFVFAGTATGPLSYTLAHESLHLFGAEDLYTLATFDPADRRDVMQVPCATAGASVVAGTTAWAIGWRDRPPARAYPVAK